MNDKVKQLAIEFAIAGVLFGGWYLLNKHDRKVDNEITTTNLGPDDRAKIVLDNANHTITRVDDTGVHKTFLNSHGPVSIVEKKDGKTVLVQRTWGTTKEPFIGVAIGSDVLPRVSVGLNLFYWQRWEFGGGLLVGKDIKDARLFIHVDYNLYGNSFIALGIDNRKTPQLMAGLKF